MRSSLSPVHAAYLADPRAPEHLAQEGDEHLDYCLAAYRPAANPAGGFRSSALFSVILQLNPLGDRLLELVARVLALAGRNKTVWGLKKSPRGYVVELYFYNHGDQDRNLRPSQLWAELPEGWSSGITPRDDLPYFMFSVEFDESVLHERRLDELRYYTYGGVGHATGFSYAHTPEGIVLENHYAFYSPRRHRHLIDQALSHSVFSRVRGASPGLAQRIVEAHLPCRRVCVARKRQADGLYFSRLPLPVFVSFLDDHRYPQPLVTFVRAHQERLGHLRFDIGLDLRVNDQGDLVISKSGFYGSI